MQCMASVPYGTDSEGHSDIQVPALPVHSNQVPVPWMLQSDVVILLSCYWLFDVDLDADPVLANQ